MDGIETTEPMLKSPSEYGEFSDYQFEGMDKYGCNLPEGERNELWIDDSPRYLQVCKNIDWQLIRVDENLEEMLREENPDKEDLSRLITLWYATRAKRILFQKFGIDDLTPLEDLGLRYFCQNFEEEYQQQKEIYDSLEGKERENVDNARMDNPALEAAYRFLAEFCGVRTTDIPFEVILIERSSGKVLQFLRGSFDSRVRIHQKNTEVITALRDSGMEYEEMDEHEGVPYYFKYYLWRERQKRHEQDDIDLN